MHVALMAVCVFFQAEDGIRDWSVTGVQTCALPILLGCLRARGMPDKVLLVLSYLAWRLTIASPCILPVLPFVFDRADRPFLRSSFPLLLGLTLTFTGVAVLTAIGGAWVVQANSYGRIVAMVLLAVFGIALLWPRRGEELARPLGSTGNRLPPGD